jgi:diguanylate cyclase (GGDEF)-like protein
MIDTELLQHCPQEWLTLADGLPSQQVHNVKFLQNRLWIASPQGLGVFDGEHIEVLSGDQWLLTHGLRSLAVHGDQLLVSSDRGLDVLSTPTQSIVHSMDTAQLGLGWCQCAVALPDNSYLLGCAKGLRRWHPRQQAPEAICSTLDCEPIRQMEASPNGVVLIHASLTGLWVFRGGKVQPLFPGGDSPMARVTYIASSAYGFVVVASDGIYQFSGNLDLLAKISLPEELPEFARAYQVAADQLLLSTATGLYEMLAIEGGWTAPTLLCNGLLVNDIVQDLLGNLWVATDSNGILKIPALRKYVRSYVAMRGNAILSVRSSVTGTATLVGGSMACYRIDATHSAQELVALRGKMCWDLIEMPDKSVWAASKAGLLSVPGALSNHVDVFRDKAVGDGRCLFGHGFTIFYGTVSGLFVFYRKSRRFQPILDCEGKTLSYVYTIARYTEITGEDAYVYVGTLGRGLWRLHKDTHALINIPLGEGLENVYCIATKGRKTLVAVDNSLLMLTDDRVELIYRGETSVLAWACAWLDDERVVFGGSTGLVVYDLRESCIQFVISQVSERQPWEFTTARSLLKSTSGALWCGTNDALHHVDLVTLMAEVEVPEPRIRRLSADTNIAVEPGFVKLQSNRWILSVALSCYWFWAGRSVHYHYRLIGLHQRWLPMHQGRVGLCSLPAGRYQMEVRVTNDLASTTKSWPVLVLQVEGSAFFGRLFTTVFAALGALKSWLLHPQRHWVQQQINRTNEHALALTTRELKSLKHKLLNATISAERHLFFDRMTGLLNKRGADNLIEKLIENTARGPATICMLVIAVDYFKDYRKFYGQLTADLCILKVAEALSRGIAGQSAKLASLDEGEFMVIMDNVTFSAAITCARRCLVATRELDLMHATSPIGEHVTVSIGCANTLSLPPHAEADARVLSSMIYNAAMDLLVAAQVAGGNRCLPAL